MIVQKKINNYISKNWYEVLNTVAFIARRRIWLPMTDTIMVLLVISKYLRNCSEINSILEYLFYQGNRSPEYEVLQNHRRSKSTYFINRFFQNTRVIYSCNNIYFFFWFSNCWVLLNEIMITWSFILLHA